MRDPPSALVVLLERGAVEAVDRLPAADLLAYLAALAVEAR